MPVRWNVNMFANAACYFLPVVKAGAATLVRRHAMFARPATAATTGAPLQARRIVAAGSRQPCGSIFATSM
jgi:hypothetical protein